MAAPADRPTFLEAQACPDCGAQDLERAFGSATPLPCPSCALKRGLTWSKAAGPGVFRCAFCLVEGARPWRRRHFLGDVHRRTVRIAVVAGGVQVAAVAAMEASA